MMESATSFVATTDVKTERFKISILSLLNLFWLPQFPGSKGDRRVFTMELQLGRLRTLQEKDTILYFSTKNMFLRPQIPIVFQAQTSIEGKEIAGRLFESTTDLTKLISCLFAVVESDESAPYHS